MTTTFPLRGPDAAGAEAEPEVADALGSALPEGFFDGEADAFADDGARDDTEADASPAAPPFRSSSPDPPPTTAYTAHPSSAPGISAASATVSGPRRDRRGSGASKSGPVYDTQPP
ncbi:hypothetical protein GCM10009535_51770 [Streptomyces thermocarboxydovorans]|uniref:Uncharacterized protein n=1 Tax=Streptomyces thermocarboxydovorans TaxID=59298 RepID=A0ABP3T1E6_9ACTN